MLLRRIHHKRNSKSKDKKHKSLSYRLRTFNQSIHFVSPKNKSAKALQRACPRGSFTVEAAFVLPLFLFAALVVLGLFPILKLQTEVNNGLQYAARTKAVAWQGDEPGLGTLLSGSGRSLFCSYMEEHGYEGSVLADGLDSISLAVSDRDGDYVTIVASYDAMLPISFWNFDSLPVKQSVKMKKWTGASDADQDESEGSYVYVTPTGSAYHSRADCPYLKLSIRSVDMSAIGSLRNASGGIYYPCRCYNGGGTAYVTTYGTQYHSDLECSSLKRTIYKVSVDAAADRHPCSKCN